jgi:peptidyl-dipeptidase A
MTREVEQFIQTTVAQLKPLHKTLSLAQWETATTGAPEASRREQEAQAAYMRFLADPERHAAAKRLHEAGAADPLTARQIKVLYLLIAENQQDEETIQTLTRLEAEVREQYYNFRGEVNGKRLSDNELDEILNKSEDSAEVKAAWEASKQVGAQVAGKVRELARVRNAAARQQGFRDHFQRSLTLNEIDEDELTALFAKLEAATNAPFATLKAEIDAARAAHFGVPVSGLRPWHYGDRFFQKPPDTGEVDMDALFADKDPVALATATYDGLGLDARDILARSDLYAREGKDQHAFCTDIDREGDVRTLNNLEPNHRWNETLLHELGHAVYEKYLDMSLPWILRAPPHTLSTEAIALMMGSLTYDREWLEQIAGAPPQEAAKVSAAARAQERALRLIFTRWALVMTNFERRMYADPERDLDTLWWDLVERYQRLTRPEGRHAPDWAAKVHVALYPVYYQNYELGFLVTAQLQDRLRKHAGGIVGRKAAGQWLVEKYFRPGAREDWAAHVKTATGEALNPQYFVDAATDG